MSKKQCCIIPRSLRESNKRLNDAYNDVRPQECQFSKDEELYEYASNYYCLLHLPPKAKKEKRLNSTAVEKFYELIKDGQRNFNFVCLEKIYFSVPNSIQNNETDLSFIGAWLWSFNLNNLDLRSMQCLNIKYSKIQGLNKISNSKIANVYITDSEVGSNIELKDNYFNLLLAQRNYFNFNELDIHLDDHNHGLIITEGNYDTIRFMDNTFDITIKIIKSSIKTLELTDNTFFVCPTFYKDNFNEIQNLVLPKLKDYDPAKMPSKKSNAYNLSWEDQYRKFREIYNIAKMRDMYIEQGWYFSLMQDYRRKIRNESKILSLVSVLYGWTSNYGQSIVRPLCGLLFFFFLSWGIFSCSGVEKWNALYLSLTQIKPYSLLYEEEPRKLISNLCDTKTQENIVFNSDFDSLLLHFELHNRKKYNSLIQYDKCDSLLQYKNGWVFISWSILGSTIFIILLAYIGLALRWNFRKS